MIVCLAANPSVDRPFEVDRLVKGAALDRGDAWDDALRLALGAGAANAEMPGAARLDPDRARALASRAEIHLL
jgi:hypothetical protein